MISRNTALAVAEVYAETFYSSYMSGLSYSRKTHYKVDVDYLYDFLYSCNYPAWFCNKSKTTSDYSEHRSRATRKLKEFIMKLHTGETQYEATSNWTWQQREYLGQEYLQNLATDILNKWYNEWQNASPYEKPKIDGEITFLQKRLELDGYVYYDSRLLAPKSDVLDTREEGGVLESLFGALGLNNKEMAFHHLKLSEEHYLDAKWDESIANSRKFLECVLQEVASSYNRKENNATLPESVLTRPVRIREYLEKEGLLETKEMAALASVYGLLSETGSQPSLYGAKRSGTIT